MSAVAVSPALYDGLSSLICSRSGFSPIQTTGLSPVAHTYVSDAVASDFARSKFARMRKAPATGGVSEALAAADPDVTSASATFLYSTWLRLVSPPSTSWATLSYCSCCSSKCTRLPDSAAPVGSVTTTLTDSGLPADATQSVRSPISSSPGSAVNVLVSATERFETSDVWTSTSYAIA